MELGHIAGPEGLALFESIGRTPLEQCLAAGVDVAKASWRLLVSDFTGRVVLGGTTAKADEAGYLKLRRLLDETSLNVGAEFLRVGVESAGHYHETLVGRLTDDGYDVVCHNPSTVKKARGEAGKSRLKTDDFDAAAICSLTIRGHGRAPFLPTDAMGDLQVAYLGREALVQHRSALRNQIHSLLDLIWPGATAKDTDLEVKPILSDILRETGMALLRLGPDPRRIASYSPSELRRKLRARGANPTKAKCRELVERSRTALSPCGPIRARLNLLARYLDVYQALCAEIESLEAGEAEALERTKGANLTSVVGLNVVSASAYVAFVGDPARFGNNPSKVWRAAGADPARSQSGPSDPNLPISREGSSWGRAAMMKTTSALVASNPVFRSYLEDRRAHGKPSKVARMAAGNKMNRMLFRLMQTGESYDLEVHRKDVERASEPKNRVARSTERPDLRAGRGKGTSSSTTKKTAGASNKNELGSTKSPDRLVRA
ncbi:MAG: IS110 family transposase [Actinomycetota bacterium]